MERSRDAIKAMIRAADCTGCDFEDTHDGNGCFMFLDRGGCHAKRHDVNSGDIMKRFYAWLDEKYADAHPQRHYMKMAWKEAFRQGMKASQPDDSADPAHQGPLSVGACDHGISYAQPCAQCGR